MEDQKEIPDAPPGLTSDDDFNIQIDDSETTKEQQEYDEFAGPWLIKSAENLPNVKRTCIPPYQQPKESQTKHNYVEQRILKNL